MVVRKVISIREKENRYGKGFFKKLSKDLSVELPEIKSFSVSNLYYMKAFYEMFPDDKIFHQVGGNFETQIFSIPWGHWKLLINKCKGNVEKALFFVKETLENNWSRAVLHNFLDTDLYERKGKAISNFSRVLPNEQSDLAQEMTKDPYSFDFLSLRDKYDEKDMKNALMGNVQKLLMELGRGFAFVGREYRLVVGTTEQFIDMLFYNITNHCYVVVEVKARAFEPGDMGQLGTYVSAVDGILKGKDDNSTVGLLICKNKDNVLAQYAVNSMKTPIGISEYELSSIVPEDYKRTMPTIEEIEDTLKN